MLCVGFPSSDLEVETQDEDEVTFSFRLNFSLETSVVVMFINLYSALRYRAAEAYYLIVFIFINLFWQVYWLQFGRYFARGPIVSF